MMNLNDIKKINVPQATPVVFVENGTRKRFTDVNLFSMDSFRDYHNMAAFRLSETPSEPILFGEFIADLKSQLGYTFDWSGDLGLHHYTFDEETAIAFPQDYRSSDGELLAWYYDGKELIFLLKNLIS